MAVNNVAGTKFYKGQAGTKGTILLGGNIPSTSPFEARNVIGTRSENYGQAEVGDRNDIDKINDSGTFNTQSRTKWVVMKVATELAGVSNDALQSGAADAGNRKLAAIESGRQDFLSALSWTADKDGMPTYSLTNNTTNVSFGQDVAARDDYNTPGKSWYSQGAMLPKETNYSKKTVI